MKNVFCALLLFVTCVAIAQDDFGSFPEDALNFVAPKVADINNLPGAENGLIVLDTSDNTFKGKSNNGSFVVLGPDRASASIPGLTNPVLVSAFIQIISLVPVVSEDYSNFINGNCTRNGIGHYTCGFTQGYWLSKPHCWVQITGPNAGFPRVDPGSTSVMTVFYEPVASNGTVDTPFYVFCKGEHNVNVMKR